MCTCKRGAGDLYQTDLESLLVMQSSPKGKFWAWRDGSMAKSATSLAGDLGSVPSTNMVIHNHLYLQVWDI